MTTSSQASSLSKSSIVNAVHDPSEEQVHRRSRYLVAGCLGHVADLLLVAHLFKVQTRLFRGAPSQSLFGQGYEFQAFSKMGLSTSAFLPIARRLTTPSPASAISASSRGSTSGP